MAPSPGQGILARARGVIACATLLSTALGALPLWAATEPSLSQQLARLRRERQATELELVRGLKTEGQSAAQIRMLKRILQLRGQEQSLGKSRLLELSDTVRELELRRGELEERVSTQRRQIRRQIGELYRERSHDEAGERNADAGPGVSLWLERERLEAPVRRLIAQGVSRRMREVESLKIDLTDADQLERQIGEERGQLTYLLQDLSEQQSVLELNRQLQEDLVQRRSSERAQRLERYQRLKAAEAEVERLISQFNARRELDRAAQIEERARAQTPVSTSSTAAPALATLKRGSLPMPVAGAVLAEYGKAFDPQTGLQVFRKGIELGASAAAPVRAVAPGTVAFAGELPGYGSVAIVDHGGHLYSLLGRLGRIDVKPGDRMQAGDSVGLSDLAGQPVYFEIRTRNVPVDPLQWVSASTILKQ